MPVGQLPFLGTINVKPDFLPAVVGLHDVSRRARPGQLAVVDGIAGAITLDPEPTEVRRAERLQRQAREAERDALKEKLARLRDSAAAAATVSTDVPVGMPDGTGDEVGVSALAFVQAFIQQNWALSPYLLDQSRLANIEAKTKLIYAADGRLKSFRIENPSGNAQFDDSLKKAIIKSQQLPQPLPKDLELVVIFNLKEMAATRR